MMLIHRFIIDTEKLLMQQCVQYVFCLVGMTTERVPNHEAAAECVGYSVAQSYGIPVHSQAHTVPLPLMSCKL